ncbi:ABC-three component system protein [Clostridium saccharoperbutylacetonicum]|uniref:ABC-three component system protein n=1 Tax=Clostridium saccharoperbutylacetonicum TaxID=36745 RepID=UPI000983C71A|nr:ABC-three component system protein [Clostridium saccharoperbutylacetonicum]AQR93405.1 hypothetical protein CLSAP_07030 [Clostridium saccharoperbutylacetonicum]NSB29102.1 putative C2H2 Zn-finger protein [Clostridium saccharoperbutylacetonicum]
MGNKREGLNKFEEQMLYTEVEGMCPRCNQPLYHEKNGRMSKSYDKAHIYPLNPTLEEAEILKDEPLLNTNVNHIDNIILLCQRCHHIFDHPRTVKEYRNLYNLKLRLIQKNRIKDTYVMFTIEDEIREVLEKLNEVDLDEADIIELRYNSKRVDEKADNSMPKLIKRQIKNDVADYFLFIKDAFKEMDKEIPEMFNTIALEIKLFYTKCKQITVNQEVIYERIVDWLFNKTGKTSKRACEIIVAYFIQDCEVF